jgi:hypothetical protein
VLLAIAVIILGGVTHISYGQGGFTFDGKLEKDKLSENYYNFPLKTLLTCQIAQVYVLPDNVRSKPAAN